MEYAMHKIKSEKDLKYYEDYLKCETADPLKTTADFGAYLKKHIGKLIKAELFSGECKTGFILEAQNGFFVIKAVRNCISTAIPFENIKYLTIIHDNDIRKTGAKIR